MAWPDLLVLIGTLLALGVGVYGLVRKAQKGESMDWKSFGRLVEQLAPIALSITGVPPALIPVIVHGIQTAEQFGGTGAEKKAKALTLVTTAIVGTNVAVGKQVIDPNAINAVSNGIDTVVGIVNLIKKQPVAPDADLVTPR